MAVILKYYGRFNRREDGWERVLVDSSLGKYLRHLFQMGTHGVHRLFPPSRGMHITLTEGEPLVFQNRANGDIVPFALSLTPRTNGNAVWCPVAVYGVLDYHLCLGYLTQEKTKHTGGKKNVPFFGGEYADSGL